MLLTRLMAHLTRHTSRNYATGSASIPPMLAKMRKDMKAAMQNKDSNRLSVLRALLTQTLNASKTSSPISTDVQMLALLRKSANTSKAACEEFRGAGRQDLVEKEEIQIKIMEEYSDMVEVMDEEAIRSVVQKVVHEMGAPKPHIGVVLQKVFSPDILGDKPVEKREVARVVKAVLENS